MEKKTVNTTWIPSLFKKILPVAHYWVYVGHSSMTTVSECLLLLVVAVAVLHLVSEKSNVCYF